MTKISTTSSEQKVLLNIYDLNDLNYYLHPIGIGAYHTGIQLFDVEFAFGAHEGANTGVYGSVPTKSCDAKFKETLVMGTTKLSFQEILDIIEELEIEYAGCTYNLFSKNCNHFSNDLCKKLLGKGIPKYLNRLATICDFIKCLFPKNFLEISDPVDNQSRPKKKDSLYLAAQRINSKKANGSITRISYVETISLTEIDEKQKMICLI